MKINKEQWKWTREPKQYSISEDKIEIITNPHTDLWQRTYYHFRNDNAPVLQMKTSEKFFSFVVKTEFESKVRFDQCGIVMYLDSENWLKGSIEYENEEFQHLGSVVTNNGYSDWATTEIDAGIKSMWYTGKIRDEFLLQKGDIITPLTEQVRGLLGNTATIPIDGIYIQSGDIGLVLPNEKKLNKRFSYYLIASDLVKKQLDSGSQQTKIRHTSPDAIKECIAFVPNLFAQGKISRLLDLIGDKIDKNNKINDNLANHSAMVA